MHAPDCDPGNCPVAHAQAFDASLPDLCDKRKAPSHVVVDERDGYAFWGSATGRPFTTREQAQALADQRNSGLRPENQTYAVYALTRIPQ